jgi:hypothetical protein
MCGSLPTEIDTLASEARSPAKPADERIAYAMNGRRILGIASRWVVLTDINGR